MRGILEAWVRLTSLLQGHIRHQVQKYPALAPLPLALSTSSPFLRDLHGSNRERGEGFVSFASCDGARDGVHGGSDWGLDPGAPLLALLRVHDPGKLLVAARPRNPTEASLRRPLRGGPLLPLLRFLLQSSLPHPHGGRIRLHAPVPPLLWDPHLLCGIRLPYRMVICFWSGRDWFLIALGFFHDLFLLSWYEFQRICVAGCLISWLDTILHSVGWSEFWNAWKVESFAIISQIKRKIWFVSVSYGW